MSDYGIKDHGLEAQIAESDSQMAEEDATSGKQYLGDGVYVTHDGFNIILTTENGIETTNEIYLEPRVWESLKAYAEKR